ncbi:NAD(P)-dependent oxidoreductase [Candidatus Woesearchaeota archaeon]|nr:NAD(P)-dependent oxidoreductase [Candidatus Woesearchaeota archaeon]
MRKVSPEKNKGLILITGGTGFIGKHLLNQLAASGRRSICVLTRQHRQQECYEGFSCVKGDLTKPETLKSLSKLNIHTAIHLAALIPNQENRNNAQEHMRQNLEGTINLFLALPPTVKHFIFMSTADVYGTPAKLPVSESHPTKPISYYAVSKLASEHFLRAACPKRNITLTILRLSHVYGPGEPVIKAIPTFISSFLGGKAPTLYSSPKEARDYVYVGDVATAIRLAAESEKGGIYNIASGKPHRIGKVMAEIRAQIKSPINPAITGQGKRQKPLVLYFSISAAKRKLGYEPKTPFAKGISHEIEWFKNANKAHNLR